VLALHYGGRARGWLTTTAAWTQPRPGTAVLRRTYRIRL